MEDGRIKVLHFPIRNTNGGITRSAMKYWKFINRDKFHFDFATCSKKLDFEQSIIEKGGKVHYISCTGEENELQFCKELKEILIQGYDVLHLNTNWWRSLLAEKVAKEAGIKEVTIHARNTSVDILDEQKRKQEMIRHNLCKMAITEDMATHFLACSEEAAAFMFGPQIPREHITIFHNALDIIRFSYNEKKRNSLRKQLGFEGKFVIGNVGRMVYQKNLFFLLDVFEKIQKKNENALLALIGNGELEKDIKNRVHEHGMDDKVFFAGAVENVEDYFQVMDVFAFPTRFEGLGTVLIEAQTAGLKCIASNSVPKETCITSNIVYLDLEQDLWVREILKYSNGYIRENTDEQIKAAGYDITKEIMVLENIYQEAVENNGLAK